MRSICMKHEIPLLSVKEAVERSGWSANYVRSLAGCGKLISTKERGRILVDAECLAILLRARATRRCRPRLRLVVDNPRN